MIDIVYLWCDGDDEKIRAKRRLLERKLGIVRDEQVNGACRYRSNDDLRYSLRSVAEYVPWIGRIFLVVDDDQTLPDWLDVTHPKIRIVRHSEIMTPDMLPSFNSNTIVSRIGFIEGLSEQCLIANDDTLFARPVSPDFFFASDGLPIIRFATKRVRRDQPSVYERQLENSERAVEARFGRVGEFPQACGRYPDHTIVAARKSDMMKLHEVFPDEMRFVAHAHFRTAEEVQPHIFYCLALATGCAHFKLAADVQGLEGPAFADTQIFSTPQGWRAIPERIARFRPAAVCLNDAGGIGEEDRAWLQDFYQRSYPRPAPWERSVAAPSAASAGDRAQPLVSVVMPVYNVAAYLRETLDSLFAQTLKDFELICLDDGSTDGTPDVVRECQAHHPNVTLVCNRRLRQAHERNLGVEKARGKYVYYLDGDDLLFPHCLETVVARAERENLDLVLFEGQSFYESEALRERFPAYQTCYHRRQEYPGVWTGRALYEALRRNGDAIVQPGLQLVRRSLLTDAGVQFPDMKRHEDNVYLARVLLAAERVACLPDALYRRRVRETSTMTGGADIADDMQVCVQAVRAFTELADAQPSEDSVRIWLLQQAFAFADAVRDWEGSVPPWKGPRAAAELKRRCDRLSGERDMYCREAAALKASAAYRVGMAVTWPLRKIYRLFGRGRS